jgi:hexosaminidase
MVGWDEIFQPGLPRDIVIQSWRGRDSLFESARRGYAGLLSNGYYIDLCQPAEKHYLNDPLPAEVALADNERALILGGEATMWSELVSPETVDSRIWPRTAAIAERLWSPADVRDVEDMYRRLDTVSVRLEELGLLHIKNQDMILRRLAGRVEIGPLKTLVEVVEPLKGYNRQNETPRYTQLSPLTRFVDAASPESRSARIFRRTVDRFAETRDRALVEAIRGQLQRWRANGDLLRPLIQDSPALVEIEPLSRDLGTAAEIGIQALDAILAGTAADASWAEDSLKSLEQAKKPKAHAELAIISGIEKLVRTTVGK